MKDKSIKEKEWDKFCKSLRQPEFNPKDTVEYNGSKEWIVIDFGQRDNYDYFYKLYNPYMGDNKNIIYVDEPDLKLIPISMSALIRFICQIDNDDRKILDELLDIHMSDNACKEERCSIMNYSYKKRKTIK